MLDEYDFRNFREETLMNELHDFSQFLQLKRNSKSLPCLQSTALRGTTLTASRYPGYVYVRVRVRCMDV